MSNKIKKTYRLNKQILQALSERATSEGEYQTRIIEEALEKELLASGHLKEKIFTQ